MFLLRNNEVKLYLGLLFLLGMITTTMNILYSQWAGAVTGISYLLCLMLAIGFILWRYRQLRMLADYIKRIRHGEYALDIRDNLEGDLSVLKSELYKVTVLLNEKNQQLVEEKKNLSISLADISHQLKTPLSAIYLLTDLLEEDRLPSAKREDFRNKILSQLGRIQWLVTALLKVSKLDAGVVVMKRELINVGEMLKSALAPMEVPMDIKNQHLVMRGDIGVTVYGDTHWMGEAILNIVKNCVEHTQESGTIEVAYEDNPLFLEIIITDTGEGIAKEDLPYVFNRFYRGKNANADSVGIGLSMARSIILQLGGDIGVTSTRGKGSRFIIRMMKVTV